MSDHKSKARADNAGVASGARTLIIVPDTGAHNRRSALSRLDEAKGLAAAISLDICESEIIRVRDIRPSTLFGKGQVEKVAALVQSHEAELVIIDGSITQIQQRNLEKELAAKVIDRTGLILEIFGARAATREGVLQVELAHLNYQASRLVRSWTHLEQQRGGFGFLGGPGETQLEADRRLIRERIAKLRRELEQVKRTRALHRTRRQKAPWPVVALVGYTNAGKSTLFNKLTQASVKAEDLLFATLDPTLRAIQIPGYSKVMLSDTVGFVSDLPTQLVAAFRATLEEVLSADLILHIRDISHVDTEAQSQDVIDVLADLGVNFEGEGATPFIEVWNKIDQLSMPNEGHDYDDSKGDEDKSSKASRLAEADRRENVVATSALSGEGLDKLVEQISKSLSKTTSSYSFTIDIADGEGSAWLYENGTVISDDVASDGESRVLHVRISDPDKRRFLARQSAATL